MPSTLVPYETPTSLTRLSDVVDRLFRESFIPPMLFEREFDGFTRLLNNLWETNESFIIQAALPGIDPEKVELRVSGRQLTIKGTYEVPPIEKATALRLNLAKGEFSEVFTLPMDVDGEKAAARYEHGILTITLPKTEQVKVKEIKVVTAK